MSEEMFSKIVGVTFDNRQDGIKSLSVGQRLILIREPENPHDCNAIKVWTEDGYGLGYISANLAEQFAPAMDKGIEYSCEVMSLTGGGDLNHGANIKIIKIEEVGSPLKIDPNEHGVLCDGCSRPGLACKCDGDVSKC